MAWLQIQIWVLSTTVFPSWANDPPNFQINHCSLPIPHASWRWGQEVARIKCCGVRGCCLVLETARPRACCWVSGSTALLSTGWGARPTAPPRGLLLQGGRTSHWFQGSWVLQQQPHHGWQCNRLGTARRWGRIKAFLRGRSAQGCSFVSLASPRQ